MPLSISEMLRTVSNSQMDTTITLKSMTVLPANCEPAIKKRGRKGKEKVTAIVKGLN